MLSQFPWLRLFAAVVLLGIPSSLRADERGHLIIDYDGASGDFTYLNTTLGTGLFYSAGYLGQNTVIGNIEAGQVWFGHDAFVRPPAATQPLFTFTNTAALNEVDYHATAVGQVLAGTGYVSGTLPEQFYFVGIGMAPYAGLWSAAIATEYSASELGAFSTTPASTLTAYKAFFQGIEGTRPDVINSSWGGDDPAGAGSATIAIDGLARDNPETAFVVSAGNSGTATVSGPASGFNNISVGSVGGPTYRTPSDFSSRGPADFHNPETGQTLIGVRAAVDIAAPGENLVLAAYLGDSGSVGASSDPAIQDLIQETPATDLYFLEMDGTSFSAPIVAGGIALLKDVAKSPTYAGSLGAEALDTRVIKAVLMASAAETEGWDNGQAVTEDGVIVTTQALDYATGSGALDLEAAAGVYVFGTTDVEGSAGGTIADQGWDLGAATLGGSNTYLFAEAFSGGTELTISLNWFSGRSFDADSDLGEDLSFADLNLQVWMFTDGLPTLLVAESASVYNNSEFLRIQLGAAGTYGITVVFEGMVFDLTDSVTSETYGLAWTAAAVPEPHAATLILVSGIGWFLTRRVRRAESRERRKGQLAGTFVSRPGFKPSV